ncbi:fumarylacetoacetate hydrolase family protein [Lactarius deliciosus]|nr:fumarylacetoacetate hydrolase family protein [Lactarius deliciosus]
MTARNLQEEVKRKGLPWSTVKGFDTFTPISSFIPRSKVADPHNLNLWLKINGQIKQSGNTSNMIFRIPRLIQHISSIMTLEEGDLVLTGTPAGVGPLAAGDKVECALVDPVTRAKVEQIAFGVTNRAAGYLYVPPFFGKATSRRSRITSHLRSYREK